MSAIAPLHTDVGSKADAAVLAPGVSRPSLPSRDVMHELRQLREQVVQLTKNLSAVEKARSSADWNATRAAVQADRAERSERQISADRDRWKALALKYEAELRSLAPGSGKK
jgi:hypothetical protein